MQQQHGVYLASSTKRLEQLLRYKINVPPTGVLCRVADAVCSLADAAQWIDIEQPVCLNAALPPPRLVEIRCVPRRGPDGQDVDKDYYNFTNCSGSFYFGPAPSSRVARFSLRDVNEFSLEILVDGLPQETNILINSSAQLGFIF